MSRLNMIYTCDIKIRHENGPELVILIGPPGSGKSTYCKSLPWHVRISQDEMGKQGHWKKFVETLEKGTEIVVDRMNFNFDQRMRYVEPAKKAGYRIKYVLFLIDIDVCLDRLKNRTHHPTLPAGPKCKEVFDFYWANYREPASFEFDKWEIIRENS